MKKVYKYATGEPLPEGAVYLNTVVEEKVIDVTNKKIGRFVWHYFLVEDS